MAVLLTNYLTDICTAEFGKTSSLKWIICMVILADNY